MFVSSAAWATVLSIVPDSRLFPILGRETYWSAASGFSLTDLPVGARYDDYVFSLDQITIPAGGADIALTTTQTISGMNINLDTAKRLLMIDGSVLGDTTGTVILYARNKTEANSDDQRQSSFTFRAVSTDLTGGAIGTNFAIYDLEGNRQDKSTYMVPGHVSRIVAPVSGYIEPSSVYVAVTDSSNNVRTIPNNTNYTGSDGYRYENANIEIWYTPQMTGAHSFTVYYSQDRTFDLSSEYYRQVFKVEGEIPGGKEGGGCNSGAGAFALLAVLPVLLRTRRERRERV
jgi:Synergist-CTERM protein sorting domain-containing protein